MATLITVTLAMAMPPAYAVQPLRLTGVLDVNLLGLLDGTGTGYSVDDSGVPITKPGQQIALQRLGKLQFFDMQVGGDGTTACASCHFTAGADNRPANQMSPGLRRTVGGQLNLTDGMPGGADVEHQRSMNILSGGSNRTTSLPDFGGHNGEGLPVGEAAVISAGGTADDPLTGAPGVAVPVGALAGIAHDDVNDVVSSAGPRPVSVDGPCCFDTVDDLANPIVPPNAVSCDDPAADAFPFPESDTAPNPVPPGSTIGGGLPEANVVNGEAVSPSPGLLLHSDPVCNRAQATLLNIAEGLRRFEAGATACSICHVTAEFTGATVSTITGFGAPPPDPFIAPGQLARAAEFPAMTESHPQLCVAVGQDPVTGASIMADLHAVGAAGKTHRLQTFEEGLSGEAPGTHDHDFSEPCTMPGVATAGDSDIDVPPL